VHFRGDDVVNVAWVERKAAVESLAIQAEVVTRAELAKDREQVLRQPGLVHNVKANGVPPGRDRHRHCRSGCNRE